MSDGPANWSDEDLIAALAQTVASLVAAGFERSSGDGVHHPTWIRERGVDVDADADKVVLWRHPRVPGTLHGYVATTRVGHMVHLRFFDPTWQPEAVLPGHVDKGWELERDDSVGQVDARLAAVWPRALTWFEAPVAPDEVLAEHGRVASVVAPGPLLASHERRARWLREAGRDEEAEHVDALVARIRALYDTAP